MNKFSLGLISVLLFTGCANFNDNIQIKPVNKRNIQKVNIQYINNLFDVDKLNKKDNYYFVVKVDNNINYSYSELKNELLKQYKNLFTKIQFNVLSNIQRNLSINYNIIIPDELISKIVYNIVSNLSNYYLKNIKIVNNEIIGLYFYNKHLLEKIYFEELKTYIDKHYPHINLNDKILKNTIERYL